MEIKSEDIAGVDSENTITRHVISIDPNDPEATQAVYCGFNRSDMGNAQRLIALYGDTIRYCDELKTWFIWDGVKWVADTTLKIQELAKETVRLIHAEVSISTYEGATDADRKALSKHAFASEAHPKISAMIKQAQSDERVSVKASDFDANLALMNFPNGTLDLESRKFCEHNRDDLLTTVTSVPYNPSQSSELFYPTLLRAMTPAEAMYAQRMLGSFLAPTTQNKEWLFVYGKPFALKSSVTQAVYAALGDYARSFPIDLLIKSKHGRNASSAQPEIMALQGVRIAWTEEAPPNFVIDEPMLKSLTSSGIKSARQIYEKQRQVELICSFVVESNGTFNVDIEDEWSRDAALERTHVMKFVNQIPPSERDPEKLIALTHDEAELTAALAWVIQGYFDRKDFGLETPKSITETSDEFKIVINPLSSFIKNEIEFATGDKDDKAWAEVWVSVKDLWQRFQDITNPDIVKGFKGARSFNIQFKKVAQYYAKLAGVEILQKKKEDGAGWLNARLIYRDDYEDSDKDAETDRLTITPKNDAKGSFGVKSSCIYHFYYTLHQNGVLRHLPTFPTLLVEGTKPVELDFLTIGEHSDEMTMADDKLTDVKQPGVNTFVDSDKHIEPVVERADLSELAQYISKTLIATKNASAGRVDIIDKEQLAKAIALTVKRQHPEWREYDVETFYKRLTETDPRIQGLIADLTGIRSMETHRE